MEHEHRVNHDRERPRSLEVNLAHIPEELQHYPSWVVWQYRVVEGDWKKPPITPASGWLASVGNSKTWGSFEEARSAYKTGRYAGIGFMLSKEAGIVGVDIDHCIRDATLDPQAQKIITQLDTYTERSPSGEGVHLFLKGKLPGVYHRKGTIELYEDKRYLTITGHAIHTPPTIPNRQTELESVYTDLFRTFVTPPNAPESTGRVGEPAQRRQPSSQ
jgi:putative DNA primase/helicase